MSSSAKLAEPLEALAERRIIDVRTPSAAKLRGRVEPIGEPLISPITARRCVAWATIVASRANFPNGLLREYHRAHGIQPFRLRDDTGVAAIAAERCWLGLLPTLSESAYRLLGSATGPEEQRCEALLRSAGRIWFVQLKGLSALRFESRTPLFIEATVDVGDEITVGGQCVPRQSAALGPYRDQDDVRLTVGAPEGGFLLLSSSAPLR